MYYNDITKENTMFRFRFKTLDEFVEDYGESWREYIRHGWNTRMDGLFGIELEIDDDFLDNPVYSPNGSFCDYDFNGGTWSISEHMLVYNYKQSILQNYIKNKCLIYE